MLDMNIVNIEAIARKQDQENFTFDPVNVNFLGLGS